VVKPASIELAGQCFENAAINLSSCSVQKAVRYVSLVSVIVQLRDNWLPAPACNLLILLPWLQQLFKALVTSGLW
jgi:hypothetical protein